VEKLRELPVITERGAQIALGTVTQISFVDGPPMLKSENARLSGGCMWTFTIATWCRWCAMPRRR